MSDLTAVDDGILLAQARAGDREAFAALVARYEGRVYRLALRLSGDPRDAEDVLQETFLQVFRKLATFRGEARFSTWLFRVATNAALMSRRGERRHDAEPLESCLPRFDGEGRHVRLDVDYAAAAHVEDGYEQRELARLVRAALVRLPPMYRAAVVLCDLEGLPAAEAAEVLRVTPDTLRQRRHRARLMLRGYLGRLAGKEDSR